MREARVEWLVCVSFSVCVCVCGQKNELFERTRHFYRLFLTANETVVENNRLLTVEKHTVFLIDLFEALIDLRPDWRWAWYLLLAHATPIPQKLGTSEYMVSKQWRHNERKCMGEEVNRSSIEGFLAHLIALW